MEKLNYILKQAKIIDPRSKYNGKIRDVLIKNETQNVSTINCSSMNSGNNGNPVPWDLLWYDNTANTIITNTPLDDVLWAQVDAQVPDDVQQGLAGMGAE